MQILPGIIQKIANWRNYNVRRLQTHARVFFSRIKHKADIAKVAVFWMSYVSFFPVQNWYELLPPVAVEIRIEEEIDWRKYEKDTPIDK